MFNLNKLDKYEKNIYIALALLTGAFASCTDSEEVEIVKHNGVTLNITTSKTFETWNLTDYQHYLGNHPSYLVGITSLVYDKNGALCDSITVTTPTFQDVSFVLNKLPDGVYNVVTFESFVNKDNNNLPDAWILTKTDKIDSLRIEKKRLVTYWYDAFGVAYTTINVGKETVSKITPEVVGCLINFEFENFDKAKYNYFSFSSQNCAEAYLLNSNLNDNNRYYRGGYDKSNLWESLAYYYSSDIIPDTYSFVYYTFETGQRAYLFGGSKSMWVNGNTSYDDVSKGYFNFERGKIYEAYCYYKGYSINGSFETYIGLHDDFASWYNNFDKTMNPVFAEPCTNWGTTVSYVKSFMKGYDLYCDITLGDGAYYMTYFGKYCEDYIEYDFEEQKQGLFMVNMAFPEEDASLDDILLALNESDEYIYDQYYEEYGYHMYYNNNTYVVVWPNCSFDDGTPFTGLQYYDRSKIDVEEAPTRSINSSRKFKREFKHNRVNVNK